MINVKDKIKGRICPTIHFEILKKLFKFKPPDTNSFHIVYKSICT
jgi:hypothetical protein